jgi:CubicO group peptidase (beta-lactamase class C family)
VVTAGDGYGLLTSPEGDIRFYVLTQPDPDITAAIAAGWALVDADFDLEIADTLEPPSAQGIEQSMVVNYRSEDPNRFAQAVAQRTGDQVYLMLIDGQLAGFQRRSAEVNTIASGYKILAQTQVDLAGAAVRTVDAGVWEPLEDFITFQMEQFGVPGVAVAIVQNGEIVFAKSYGVADPATGALLTPETRMMIGSSGKSLSTLLMATLVDDGLMSWDTPAIAIYPDFAVADPALSESLTMRNLVCACTGVPRRDLELLFNANSLSAADMVASLADFTFFTKLGETFQYSNQMVGTAGYLAGHLAATPATDFAGDYAQALQERVLAPIGMVRTTLDFATVVAEGNYATPHAAQLDGGYQPLDLAIEQLLAPIGPAGAHWSTLLDMAAYLQMALAGGVAADGTVVVSPENLHETWLPQVTVDAETSYGLGWLVGNYKGQRMLFHGGNTLGFTTDVAFLPEADLGIVVMANAQGANFLTDGTRLRLLEILFDQAPEVEEGLAFFRLQYDEQVAELAAKLGDSVDSAAVADWLTTFTSDELGSVTLAMAGTDLFLDAGEFATRLLPIDDDEGVLAGYIQLDAPLAGLLYRFERDEAGAPIIKVGQGLEEYTFTQR